MAQQLQDGQALWDELVAEREAEGGASGDADAGQGKGAGKGKAHALNGQERAVLGTLLRQVLVRVAQLEGHVGGLTRNHSDLRATVRSVAARHAASGGVNARALHQAMQQHARGQANAVRKEVVEAALHAVLPGWLDEVKTPQFAVWLQAQPNHVRALAASPHVGDAARMLKLYEQTQGAGGAQQILEQRRQRLAAAVAPPRAAKAPALKGPEQMSPAELWDYEARLRERRKAALA